MTASRPRVAVIGAGPAGAFTASLLRTRCDVEVDIFERLPTPWGLLRYGVAPDHTEIKTLADRFEKETFGRGCRFIGNVEVGTDVSHAELTNHYTAVFYATGAQHDRPLGLLGEERSGSLSAREFVFWYNGHPDYRDLHVDLSGERAVVVGNGNVAADVARILVRDPDELSCTDIAEHALHALRHSAIREVVILGRRGPGQAAFSHAALRELSELAGVELCVDPADLALDAASSRWLAEEASFTARRNVELLRHLADRRPEPGPDRRITLKFLRSPAALNGSDRIESLVVRRNEIGHVEADRLRGWESVGEEETLDCSLILRAVGYRSGPVSGLPFDEERCVLPNDRGRVMQDGATLVGVYAVGWLKRGPKGILGSNKRDAEETVTRFAADLDSGILPIRPTHSSSQLDQWVASRKPTSITVEGWHAIDRYERERGQAGNRPRLKLTSLSDLLATASGVVG
ncbi:FAD-dependent oxidoreductase [Nocardioides sp. AN3]